MKLLQITITKYILVHVHAIRIYHLISTLLHYLHMFIINDKIQNITLQKLIMYAWREKFMHTVLLYRAFLSLSPLG